MIFIMKKRKKLNHKMSKFYIEKTDENTKEILNNKSADLEKNKK